jgi:hypothetical protein
MLISAVDVLLIQSDKECHVVDKRVKLGAMARAILKTRIYEWRMSGLYWVENPREFN